MPELRVPPTSQSSSSDGAPAVSAPLLSAALAGLLCMGACGSDDSNGPVDGAKVTLERVDPNITEQSFKAKCDEAMGTLETHSHCGSMNSCKGFSYYVTKQIYSEHTCKGLNTCTGWSCVVPDET